MDEDKIYYKVCYPTSIVMFYHDLENDKLDGFIEEYKTGDRYVLKKHTNLNCYDEASKNSLCISMIKSAKRINERDYFVACEVVNAMLDPTDWLMSNYEAKEENKVVTETVYV